MLKATILYIVALWLLGEAVSRLQEESRKEGYLNGLDQGYYNGRLQEIDMQEKLRLADVHRES